jgi:hypothetical protein
LRLGNYYRRNCGCQNNHHDQEERDCLCAYHREPPFAKMEGSFCGAPNQSTDFSKHATRPLKWLIMYFLPASLPLFYATRSQQYASKTGNECVASRANRSKK